MKTIHLSKNKIALVDDDIYEYLIQWKWSFSRIYATRADRSTEAQKTIYMHKVVLPSPEGMQIDHINGDCLDNRRENLRICTPADNAKNRSKNKNNTTGYPGVGYHHGMNRYRARISVNGKQKHLGFFKTVEEAIEARKKGAAEAYGEFLPTDIFRLTKIQH